MFNVGLSYRVFERHLGPIGVEKTGPALHFPDIRAISADTRPTITVHTLDTNELKESGHAQPPTGPVT